MNKNKTALGIITAIAVSINAQATVVTFDDYSQVTHGDSIDRSYFGMDWSDFKIKDATKTTIDGYVNGLVSGDNVGLNVKGRQSSIFSDDIFTFNGAYFNAAWRDDLNLTVSGYRNTRDARYFQFDVEDITRLVFDSFSPTNASTCHFTTDDLTFNEVGTSVPEPSTAALFGLGLFGLLASRMKRKTVNA